MGYRLLDPRKYNLAIPQAAMPAMSPEDEFALSMALEEEEPGPLDMNRAPAGSVIPGSGGAFMDSSGMVTLPPVFAEGAPAIPREDGSIAISVPLTKAEKPEEDEYMAERIKNISTEKSRQEDSENSTERATDSAKSAVDMRLFDPESFAGRMRMAADIPAIQNLTRGLDAQESMIREELANPGTRDVDLRGLAAFVDNQYGTNYGAYLDRPVQDIERQKVLMGALDKVQDNRRDLAKALLETTKAQEVGKTSKSNTIVELVELLTGRKGMKEQGQVDIESEVGRELQDKKEAAAKARGGRADLRIVEKDIRDSMDKTMLPMNERYTQLLNARESLAKNDLQSVAAILSILAKSVGADSGALSNQDISRFLPSTVGQTFAQVQAYLTNNPSAALDPKITKGLKSMVDLAARNLVDRYDSEINTKYKQFKNSASASGVNVDAITAPARDKISQMRKLGSFSGKEGALKNATNPSKKSALPKRTKPIEEMTAAERKAYKESLKGALKK